MAFSVRNNSSIRKKVGQFLMARVCISLIVILLLAVIPLRIYFSLRFELEGHGFEDEGIPEVDGNAG